MTVDGWIDTQQLEAAAEARAGERGRARRDEEDRPSLFTSTIRAQRFEAA